VNSRSVKGDLKSIAACEFDDGPPWLYRHPYSGMRGAGITALCDLQPIDHNKNLTSNCAQLHGVLIVAHANAATREASNSSLMTKLLPALSVSLVNREIGIHDRD
jgi:hypothetical protein